MSRKEELKEILVKLSLARNDQLAWEHLYKTAWPFVYTCTLRLLRGHKDLAQDASQEVFLKVLKYADFSYFRNENDFLAYLRVVSRNVVLDLLDEASKFADFDEQEDLDRTVEEVVEPTASQFEKTKSNELLKVIMGKVDDKDKALILMMLEGYSLAEIDKKTGLSYSAAATRIHRLRRDLRNHLKKKKLIFDFPAKKGGQASL